MNIQKVGIIFNPAAGHSEFFKTIGKILSKKLISCKEIITGPDKLGAAFIPEAKAVFIDDMRIEKFVDIFCDLGIDMLIGVGGDGTLNRLASRLLQINIALPVMGIAAGTANVGPLIQFNRRALELFELSEATAFEINPIEIYVQDRLSGYAFVDAVIGETFLGTINGSMECLDARAFWYRGEKKKRMPSLNIMEKIEVSKNGKNWLIYNVAQIIAAPLYHARFFTGKAATGALCWAWHLQKKAVVSFAAVNIIDPYIDHENLTQKEPVVISHVLLGHGEIVEIRKIPNDKFLILDGNPIFPVGGQVIRIRVTEKGVLVVSNKNKVCMEKYCGPVSLDWDE